MQNPPIELAKKLNYKFNNPELLEQALRHRSTGLTSNERLEFLGDSALNFIIADILYTQYPKYEEGILSRLRANLVNGKTLAEIAKELNIGDYLQLGAGERKSGGTQRTSILADTCEAILGAIYLDSNIKICKKIISKLYKTRLKNLSTDKPKDPKTTLQEMLQSKKLPLPTYEIIKIEGAAHAQIFNIKCKVPGIKKTTIGIGSNRRQAEQDAAEKFLSLCLPL